MALVGPFSPDLDQNALVAPELSSSGLGWVSDDLIQTPSAASLDDGDWWSGQQQNAVGIARAGLAAALALSAALCAGLQQQTDEVVPWLPSEAASAPPTQRARVSPTLIRWGQGDELPTAAVALDDGDWQPLARKIIAVNGIVWAVDDEIVPQIAAVHVDEEPWQPPVTCLPASLPAAICAGLQQQTEDVITWLPSEGASAPPTQRATQGARFIKWDQPDELPTSATAALEQDDWRPPLLARSIAPQQQPWADDEFPHVVVEEEYWHRLGSYSPAPQFYVAPADDEVTQAPGVLRIEEADWQVYTPPLGAARPLYLPDPEEIPAATLSGTPDELYWQTFPQQVRALWAPILLADDEIVPQPATLLVDEQPWAQPQILPAAPRAEAFRDDDVLPAAAATIEESYWQTFPAQARAVWAPVALSTDEVVQQPAPLRVDEQAWFNLAPARASYRFYRLGMAAQDDGGFVVLSAIEESLARTYFVIAQGRVRAIDAEHRTLSPNAEDRKLIVDPQQRSLA